MQPLDGDTPHLVPAGLEEQRATQGAVRGHFFAHHAAIQIMATVADRPRAELKNSFRFGPISIISSLPVQDTPTRCSPSEAGRRALHTHGSLKTRRTPPSRT